MAEMETKELQTKLDDAQADLQQDVAELKEVVEAKLETPAKVISKAKGVFSFVQKHALELSIATVALVVVVVAVRQWRD